MASAAPDLARYHRQTLLPGVGEEGQRRLLASSALILGCGALGSVIADALVRAGVGHTVLVDRDFVELTNLQRQVLYDEADVAAALPKAVAAKRKLARINSGVRVTAHVEDVTADNIERLAGVGGGSSESLSEPVGVIVDGLDNFETRYLANDVAVKHGIPYVYGGAVGTTGASFTVLPHTMAAGEKGDTAWERLGLATPDLRDVFEHAPPPGSAPTCDTAGVLGPVVSMIGAYQAAEALKVLLGQWEAVSRTMLHIDLWSGIVRQFRIEGAYEAGEGICSKQRRFDYLEGRQGATTTTLCGREAVQIAAPRGAGDQHRLDLAALAARLERHGAVTLNPFMLRGQFVESGREVELSVFRDGRAIIKGTKEAAVARAIYAKYVGS